MAVATPGYALYVDGNGAGAFAAGAATGAAEAVFRPSAFEQAMRASGSTRYALRNALNFAIT
jgi:hypothetical protein